MHRIYSAGFISDKLPLVVLQGMRRVFIGSAIGLAGAAGVSGILRSILASPRSADLLFGVGSFDPVTFAGLTSSESAAGSIRTDSPFANTADHSNPMAVLTVDAQEVF
jgi:hypothetical protein